MLWMAKVTLTSYGKNNGKTCLFLVWVVKHHPFLMRANIMKAKIQVPPSVPEKPSGASDCIKNRAATNCLKYQAGPIVVNLFTAVI